MEFWWLPSTYTIYAVVSASCLFAIVLHIYLTLKRNATRAMDIERRMQAAMKNEQIMLHVQSRYRLLTTKGRLVSGVSAQVDATQPPCEWWDVQRFHKGQRFGLNNYLR